MNSPKEQSGLRTQHQRRTEDRRRFRDASRGSTVLPRDYIDGHKPDKDGVIHITTKFSRITFR